MSSGLSADVADKVLYMVLGISGEISVSTLRSACHAVVAISPAFSGESPLTTISSNFTSRESETVKVWQSQNVQSGVNVYVPVGIFQRYTALPSG